MLSAPAPPDALVPLHSLPSRLFISSGEASGDLHGAHLMQAMRRLAPELRFYGIGGQRMAEEGLEQVADSANMAIIGIAEVFRHVPFLTRLFSRIVSVFDLEPPDAVLLIDYPDYNFLIGQAAHRRGIPVYYYISPQIWAWRQGRVRTMREFISKMFVLFPFEEQFYEASGLPCEFVGNPVVGEVRERMDPDGFRERHKLPRDKTFVTLMPGSRGQELRRLAEPIFAAAGRIAQRRPDVHFLVPVPGSLREDAIEPWLTELDAPYTVVRNDATSALAVSAAAIIKSGTSTLEAAIVGTPFCVVYKLAPLSWRLAQWLVSVKHASIVNLLAGKELVREYLQDAVEPEAIANEVLRLLSDEQHRDHLKLEFSHLTEALRGERAADRAAEAILRAFQNDHPSQKLVAAAPTP